MLDIKEILKLIPHRYPFLLVDRIIEIQENETILGLKNITFNEPQFIGHFPEMPVMPGVLIIEALAQVSAILVAKSMESREDKEVLFMSIDSTKFRKVVIPGDSLFLRSKIIQSRAAVWKFEALAEVEGKVVAESHFTAMVRIKERENKS